MKSQTSVLSNILGLEGYMLSLWNARPYLSRGDRSKTTLVKHLIATGATEEADSSGCNCGD